MDDLIGRVIASLYVSPGEQRIAFEGELETLTFEAVGDCCSCSWFADILNVDALLGQEVVDVETLQLPHVGADGRTRQQYDLAYGYAIVTRRGRCEVIFRNSSNGYYGGWLDGPTVGKLPPEGWRKITEDWTA